MGIQEQSATYSLLFVCLGNICRSPMAKAVFDYTSHQKGNRKIEYFTSSAGTGAYHVGEKADPRTLQVCLQKGVPLVHTARQIDIEMALAADMILAMDKQNLKDLQRWGPEQLKNKLYLFGEFDPLYPNSEVPDPYYGGIKDFETVFEQLYRCSEGLISQIQVKMS